MVDIPTKSKNVCIGSCLFLRIVSLVSHATQWVLEKTKSKSCKLPNDVPLLSPNFTAFSPAKSIKIKNEPQKISKMKNYSLPKFALTTAFEIKKIPPIECLLNLARPTVLLLIISLLQKNPQNLTVSGSKY